MTTTGRFRTSAFPRVAPTGEAAWLAWAARLPPLDADFGGGRLVVVAPHPDDETLACGGLIARCRPAGIPVVIVAVTDGEGSHPSALDLARRRRAEQDQALVTLGIPDAPIRLALPDGAVAAHERALATELGRIVRENDVLVAPWRRDGHCDHDASGRVATELAARLGCRHLAYPVWAWQWAVPADLGPGRWVASDIDGEARTRKLEAIEAYRTQTTDTLGEVIVDADALVRFRRGIEVFVDAG